jgi:adenylate cyclase
LDLPDYPVFFELAEQMNRNNIKDSLQPKLENIKLDLGTYKILLNFQNHREPFAIHFDKPARRFYFSLIALVVTEMKNLDKPDFIHIRKHENTLKLLDNSLAGQYTSKTATGMWDKVRKAWRYTLPDLETGTHFKILDRDLISPYEKGGKYRYECSDDECDIWANLFGYDESNPWRFKFAIDLASLNLNDISVTLGDLRDDSAWQEFVKSLKVQPKAVSIETRAVPNWWKKAAFSLIAILIVVAVTAIIWNSYMSPVPLSTVFELPDRPSIAVLPFNNLSEDPKQEYFSDGMTEEIITALSKVPSLFVIARNSTFSYKGKPVNIRQVAEELGVRYVLEGSVRRSGDRVRVTAQLIDAIKGHHLWAERYERELKDTFALQDEITGNILSALAVKLTRGEQATIRPKGTDNLDAYLKELQSVWYSQRMTKEGIYRSRQLAEEAMALDPEYASPYLSLAIYHIQEVFFGWSKSRKESVEQALELAQKAISLDESSPGCHRILSVIYMFKKQYEKAVAEAERAIALEPNYAEAYSQLGTVLQMMGRKQEAIEPLEKAIRINPMAPSYYFRRLGTAYRDIGRYEDAIIQLKKAIHLSPDSLYPHIALAATYSLAGRDVEARAEASEVLRIQPKISLKSLAKRVAYKNKADIDKLIDALRKAGLPE